MDIIEFPNYTIYNDGRIYSKTRKIFMKPIITHHGYVVTGLSKNGKQHHKLLHRLVAQHYVPNPRNVDEVDHIDRNPGNFNFTNLRWTTKTENHQNKGIPKHNISGFKCIAFSKSNNKWMYSKMINRSNIQVKFATLTETLCFKFLYITLNKIGKDINYIKNIHKQTTATILRTYKSNKQTEKARIELKTNISDGKHLRYIKNKRHAGGSGYRYTRKIDDKYIDISFTNIVDALCFKFILNIYKKCGYDVNNLANNYRIYIKAKKIKEKSQFKDPYILNSLNTQLSDENIVLKNENVNLKYELSNLSDNYDVVIINIKRWLTDNSDNISYKIGNELFDIINSS